MESSFDTSNPWKEFTYSIDLDVTGKYWMFWTPDDETKTITFEVITARIRGMRQGNIFSLFISLQGTIPQSLVSGPSPASGSMSFPVGNPVMSQVLQGHGYPRIAVPPPPPRQDWVTTLQPGLGYSPQP